MRRIFKEEFTTYLFVLVICSFAWPQTGHAQDQLVLESASIAKRDTVWVFKPSNYDRTNNSIPAVYLLHGYAGSYHQWNDIADLQKLADQYSFIIITPDGFSNSWYINSPKLKKSNYKDFFFHDLMAKMNEEYRIDTDQTFITGLSMGGHGADITHIM